jgi:Protein of unknown function (DUF3237)
MMNRRELLGSVGAASLLPSALAAPASAQFLPAFQAALRLGPAQDSAGNHRWAGIIAGKVTGPRLSGRVQSGRMDWFVDPASGAVEIAMTCSVLRPDGTTVELRDRTALATVSERAALPGHPTAPVLLNGAGGAHGVSAHLVGRLDTTAFWRGFVSLRAFAPA